MAGRLRPLWRGRTDPAPPLPCHGLAGRGTPGRSTGRSNAFCPAHGQRPRRGAAVRAPARPVQRTLGRVHGYDLAVVHRRGWADPGRAGLLQGHRPDLLQMIVGVVIDAEGRPVCSEMWPGNTADVSVLVPVIDRLRSRFAIGRVCVVADRGMISAPTIAALEERGLEYVLGARERTDSLVRTVVLADQKPFTPLCIPRASGEEPQLFIKEFQVE